MAGTKINVFIDKVTNPSRAIITDLFKFDVMFSSTTVTIEESPSVPGLQI